jgi:hypothetical protein
LVDPGTYSLDFDAPSGYAFTRRDARSNDAIDSGVEPLTERTAQFTVTTANNLNIDGNIKGFASFPGVKGDCATGGDTIRT